MDEKTNKMVKFLVCLLCFGVGQYVGQLDYKKTALQQCKEAGWGFVDNLMRSVPDSHSDKQKITNNLQSGIATECIKRFD